MTTTNVYRYEPYAYRDIRYEGRLTTANSKIVATMSNREKGSFVLYSDYEALEKKYEGTKIALYERDEKIKRMGEKIQKLKASIPNPSYSQDEVNREKAEAWEEGNWGVNKARKATSINPYLPVSEEK